MENTSYVQKTLRIADNVPVQTHTKSSEKKSKMKNWLLERQKLK